MKVFTIAYGGDADKDLLTRLEGQPAAFGKGVSQQQDAEDPGRFLSRVLAVVEAERARAEFHAANARGDVRARPVMQHGVRRMDGRRVRPPARRQKAHAGLGAGKREHDERQAEKEATSHVWPQS